VQFHFFFRICKQGKIRCGRTNFKSHKEFRMGIFDEKRQFRLWLKAYAKQM
jgi:hypothetical protein